MENERDSERFYLNEWGDNPLFKYKDEWGKELFSEFSIFTNRDAY